MWVVLLALLTAEPDAGTPPAKPTPVLSAPLGRIGDVVTPPPNGGVANDERAVVGKLPGCDKTQAIYFSRFLYGAAQAGGQVHEFLLKQPELMKALFPKTDRLVDAVQRAKKSLYKSEPGCLSKDWKIDPFTLVACKTYVAVSAETGGEFWFKNDGAEPNARVRLSAAPETAKDRCRPRLSAVLEDGKGRPVFAYHADYGADVEAIVYGDKCQALSFTFDPKTQTFTPSLWQREGCKK